MFSPENQQSHSSLMRQLHEYGILLFAFSLPIFEAPKHLGYCMMVVGFLGVSLYKKTIRLEKPNFIEYLLIAILITSAISTFLNWPLLDGIKGLKHLFYHISTFWILYRNKYNKKFLIKIPMALVLGTLVGIFWAEYHLFFSQIPLPAPGEFELKFNSVNSVSRSSAFNASILFVCAGVLMDNVYKFKRRAMIFFTIAWVIISACTLIMGGRGNVLSILGAYLFLFIPLLKHKKYLYFISIQTAIALIAIILLHIYSGAPQTGRFKHLLSTKFTTNISAMGMHDQIRYDYWRIGLAQIYQHPSLFGVGPRNFKSIKVKDLHLQPPLLQKTIKLISHAPQHSHNWVLTKCAEDGVAGLALFLGLIFTLFFTLWRHRPSNEKGEVSWIWVAAFSAIITAVISGFFNSAFTHENGWLTFFLIGLGAGYTRQKSRGEKEQC